MLECDVEMPDVGVVTVAVTHLVSLDQLARQLSLIVPPHQEQSRVELIGTGMEMESQLLLLLMLMLLLLLVFKPGCRLMLSYCLPYLV